MSISTVRARLPYYSALRQAAQAQREALESDDLEAFQKLLSEREELLAGIEILGSGPGWADKHPDRPVEAPSEAAGLLADIIETDRELQRLLSERIEAARADITLWCSGRGAARHYPANNDESTPYLDSLY